MGLPGLRGISGTDGEEGLKGFKGEKGSNGTQGSKGQTFKNTNCRWVLLVYELIQSFSAEIIQIFSF